MDGTLLPNSGLKFEPDAKNIRDEILGNPTMQIQTGYICGINIKPSAPDGLRSLFVHVKVDIDGRTDQYDYIFNLESSERRYHRNRPDNTYMRKERVTIDKKTVKQMHRLYKLRKKTARYCNRVHICAMMHNYCSCVNIIDMCGVDEFINIVGSKVNIAIIDPSSGGPEYPEFAMFNHGEYQLGVFTKVMVPDAVSTNTDSGEINVILERYAEDASVLF